MYDEYSIGNHEDLRIAQKRAEPEGIEQNRVDGFELNGLGRIAWNSPALETRKGIQKNQNEAIRFKCYISRIMNS